MAPAKLIRLDAEESYIRGLLSSNPEQQEKWFVQANKLDPQFSSPAFELGRLALRQNNYRQAISWLQRIPATDMRYGTARFKMGLAAFRAGDFGTANGYFHETSKQFPLSEVYNNIGAAENELNQPAAIEDFRRALEGDQNDSAYLFNLSLALLKNNQYEEATKNLRLLLTQYPDDTEARNLYNHATGGESIFAGSKAPPQERLKEAFNETAYRQLKAALEHLGN
jgi:tetratricopeptide (TPR) repeat protein